MKKTMHVVAPAVALCLTLLALTSVPTQAQSFTGSISGTVSDPSGAVVNNATVTLTALATGQTRTVTTNHAGEYNFPSLPPGEYKIRIAASGFTTGEISAQLAVAQQLRADAQLKVGTESETVNISLTESKKLQFRAEMFNPFNHPNLFVAGGTNNIANNATDSVEVTRGGLFDNINNVEQHRNVQLALKFIF